MLYLLAFALLGVSAQSAPWQQQIDVFYEAGAVAALYPSVINIPYLVGSNLTVDVVNAHYNFSFELCLKQNVAQPPVSYNNWGALSNCAIYTFSPPPAFESDKRATVLLGSSALHGSGSAAGLSASSTYSSSSSSVLSRRSLSAWSGWSLVRTGMFFATVAITNNAPTSNVTIQLSLQGSVCPNGGYGESCTPATPLTPGTPVPLSLAIGESALFVVDGAAFNASTGSVALSTATAAGQGQLWARWAAPPLAAVYDATSSLTVGDATATIASPRAGWWFVLLANPSNPTNATLHVNVTLTVNQCATNFGVGCAITTSAIGAAGVVTDNTNAANQSSIYVAFNAQQALAIAAAADDSTQPPPALYAKLGSLPTPTDFDYSQCNVASCSGQRTLLSSAAYVAPALLNDTWYALIIAEGPNGVSYWNAAGCANNCTSSTNGNCSAAIGACVCAQDYSSFDCSESGTQLERWEWALIIGGGVLVAIGLVGCIVYFIQKQQRRKGFERV